MPYIKQKDRKELKTRNPKNAGELNYKITKMVHKYVSDNGSNYQAYNDVLGSLQVAMEKFETDFQYLKFWPQLVQDIVHVLNDYRSTMLQKDSRYLEKHYIDMVGAIRGVELELYRRHIADYENLKIKENGDV